MWVNEDGQTPIEWVQDKAPDEAQALVTSVNKDGRYTRVRARKVGEGKDIYDIMEQVSTDIEATLSKEGNSARFRLEWNDAGKVGQSDLESLGCSTFIHIGPSVETSGGQVVNGSHMNLREIEFVRNLAELRNIMADEKIQNREERAQLFEYVKQALELNFTTTDRVMTLSEKVMDSLGQFNAAKAEADLEKLKLEQEHELKNAAVEGVALAASPVFKALGAKLGISSDDNTSGDDEEYRVDE